MIYLAVGHSDMPLDALLQARLLVVRLSEKGLIARGSVDNPLGKLVLQTAAAFQNPPGDAQRFWRLMEESGCSEKDISLVLGEDLRSPPNFVICWTPDGAQRSPNPSLGAPWKTLALADENAIPIVNLQRSDWKTRLECIVEF